jgi:hypothetical protein
MVLRGYGYNAKFVEELGLRGRSDEDVFAAAWKDASSAESVGRWRLW